MKTTLEAVRYIPFDHFEVRLSDGTRRFGRLLNPALFGPHGPATFEAATRWPNAWVLVSTTSQAVAE